MKSQESRWFWVSLPGLVLFGLGLGQAAWSKEPGPLLSEAFQGPMKEVREVVFCPRVRYDDGHWYANIGYYCDDQNKKAYAGNGNPDEGKLYRLNLVTGEKVAIVDDPGGSIRDPQVHYDGQKVLFSWRKSVTDCYHLYEVNLDGSGVRQITSGDYDDYEPTYLPDGGIAFVSTRCKRWVNCWMTQVGVIYRCDGDGGNVECISANTEHDNTPWVLPDGRLIYTRWEYVDRSQVEYHHLWTMNEDGTSQMVYLGNMRSFLVMIDAKPIPGTDKVVASFSPGHGVNEHAGVATVVDPKRGPDDESAVRPLHKGGLTRDPYALSEECFLVARGKQVVLLDGKGGEEVLYSHEGPGEVHEPRPVMARPRERVAPRRTEPTSATGQFVLADVYNSRNMKGVNRGEIRKLLLLESLPKPVNFSGGPDLLTWLGTFTLERVVGTVPVEADGSAYFEAPAGRQLFFVALDEKDLSVKRMQSFTCVMPGEVLSCVGCHEDRTQTPENRPTLTLAALMRPPSQIQPFAGYPDVLDFQRDVQPVLDRNCVSCHNPEKREGRVNLAGDLGSTWSLSYYSLLAYLQVADGRNGLGNQPARSLGSAASPLLRKLEGGHYDVKATPEDWRTVWLWIESGAPYAGSYAGLRNQEDQSIEGKALGQVYRSGFSTVYNTRCASCHAGKNVGENMRLPFSFEERQKRRKDFGRPTGNHERLVLPNDPIALFSLEVMLNFTRPELSSLLLAPLSKEAGGYGTCPDVFKDKSDPGYQSILSALKAGQEVLDQKPRYSKPGFRPNWQYVREMKKFGVLPPSFDPDKDALDVFDTDQKYWRSLWWGPEVKKEVPLAIRGGQE